jgi:hypothetical protein
MSPSEVAISTYRAILEDIGRKQAFALARDDLQEYGDLEWARVILLKARRGEEGPVIEAPSPECACIECLRWAAMEHPACAIRASCAARNCVRLTATASWCCRDRLAVVPNRPRHRPPIA